ncbi:MAG TPA: glutamate-cysteine ligase family protein [Patescibacteria group bacterium]|nr:glutamate-cysteine ligase family protein [Patescibacteria group bacterium]
MLSAFNKMSKEQISKVPKGFPTPTITMVGAEQELFIYREVEGKSELITDEEKNEMLAKLGDDFGPELGASCIEVHPAPVDLTKVGFSGWLAQLRDLEKQLWVVVEKHGCKVGRYGTIPWADTQNIQRTKTPKYTKVPTFHNLNKTRKIEETINGVNVLDAAIVGILNAFQFSVQCNGLEDAVDKLNRLYMISPLSVALSGNARFLGGVDTGWEDVRFEAWKRSHDTRSEQDIAEGKSLRVGLPNNYFNSIEDYMKEVSSYPFILEDEAHALQIGIGLFWRDARIKFIKDKAIVEFRPVSTQKTVEEEIEIAAFTIGRLIYSQSLREELIQMPHVSLNKKEAEIHGLRGSYIYNVGLAIKTSEIMLAEIERAQAGLKISGIPDSSSFSFLKYKDKIAKIKAETGR